MTSSLLHLTAAPDLVEQVYGRLLDAISEGTLPPGERLTQEDLAQRLAVSRQPVLQGCRCRAARRQRRRPHAQSGHGRLTLSLASLHPPAVSSMVSMIANLC